MSAELYKFFCVSFSAPHFRQWIARLAPDGHALALALPGDHVDALTLFAKGADLLIRQNCIDAALFTALFREFPRRVETLRELAMKCGVRWEPPIRWINPRSPRLGSIASTLVVCCVAAITWHFLAPSEPELVRTLLAQESDPAIDPPLRHLADAIVEVSDSTDTGAQAHDEGPATARHSTTHNDSMSEAGAKSAASVSAPENPPSACTFPSQLLPQLRTLAQTLLRPGPSETFTVTFPDGAKEPTISPGVRPGQRVHNEFHAYLATLGAAEFGGCRNIPIEITFSAHKTKMGPQL